MTMATDSEAAAAGFNIPTDTNTQVSGLPGIIRQNARAASPTPWVNCSLATGASVPESADRPMVRFTAEGGLEFRGEVILTANLAMDATIFTTPVGYRSLRKNKRWMAPSMNANVSNTQGPAYCALAFQVELRTDGRVTLRQATLSGTVVTVATVVPYLD